MPVAAPTPIATPVLIPSLTRSKIKGSIRERANGLIELRTQALGSLYGRTREEIEAKLTKALKEAKKSKNGKLEKKNKAPLLSEFYSGNYLPYKKMNLAPKSIESIELWFKFIVKSGMDKPLNKYTSAEIEKFLYSIPQTRKRQIIRGIFNNIFTYAKRLDVIKNNPCDNVEQMKHERKNGRALSFKDQSTFFNSLFSADSKATEIEKSYLTFVYLTGTRCNEALNLKVKDIDFENNTLHIRGTKTKGSDRTIPMFPLVKKLLKGMDLSRNKVFDISIHTARKAIHKVTNDYHLHELRHTFGTIAVCVRKLDVKTVSLWLGHSTVGMTLTTYTHPEQLDKALFYDGSKTETEKLEIMRSEYAEILKEIENNLQ